MAPIQFGDTLKVVGGDKCGGILVREGKGVTSAEAQGRLSTGALVSVAAHEAGRLRFELVDGDGPATGWVSLRAGGKPLLVHADEAETEAAGQRAGKSAECALRYYGQRLKTEREQSSHEFQGYDRRSFNWREPGGLCMAAEKMSEEWMRAELNGSWQDPLESPAAKSIVRRQAWKGKSTSYIFEDPEGELVLLCRQCCLPLGDFAYTSGDDKRGLLHAECMAQRMVQDMRKKDEARKKSDAELKHARHEAYDIGWKVEAMPQNAGAVRKLGCPVVPQGMCCLAVDQTGQLTVAPTLEPASAVNLEYLSVALQVRRVDGREPMFSLDPVERRAGNDPEGSMQVKRFVPEWLAGTSLGEVMFQADYHLKELSMGEYEQPVVGMKSCFDIIENEQNDKEWSAREWFIVRSAEVQVSNDNVLIPELRLGVEAREQIASANGTLEDARLTRPDHPLVKYAKDFTHNFELIAERKSVVSQLREVAKASVLAKFLMESGMQLHDSWFNLAEQQSAGCCLEVPQLWNERCYSKISVKDGALAEDGKGKLGRVHGVYGGVDFGIDRFRLSAPSRVATSVVAGRAALGRPSSTLMATTQQRLTMGRVSAPMAMGRISAPLSMARVSAPMRVGAPGAMPRAPMAMGRVSAPLGMSVAASRAGLAAPRGVDLNLDQFNLSSAGAVPLSVLGDAADASLAIGNSFWSGIGKDSASPLEEEDKSLFRSVFNPHLSDRRDEGDNFTPPPTSVAYMKRLKSLVKEEEALRHQRKLHFLSDKFGMENAGPLFPSSWTSSFELAQGAKALLSQGKLHPRPDYDLASLALQDALADAAAVYDNETEDGVRFRIYRFGSIEVRTTQEHDGKEVVGIVFSAAKAAAVQPTVGANKPQLALEQKKLAKATEYVERTAQVPYHRSYVVLETESGHAIVTEKLPDGIVTWQEDPADLEDRNSLAKVIRSKDCLSSDIRVKDIKDFRAQELRLACFGCKRYAQAVYCGATGEAFTGASGFRRQGRSSATVAPQVLVRRRLF